MRRTAELLGVFFRVAFVVVVMLFIALVYGIVDKV